MRATAEGTTAERVRAGLEKAVIKCHNCGGVKPARNAKCNVEATPAGDVGVPCPGGELGYKARLLREREDAVKARARAAELTPAPAPQPQPQPQPPNPSPQPQPQP